MNKRLSTYVRFISKELNSWLVHTPEHCFDSFAYTRTGSNLSHPLALGALSTAVAAIPDVKLTGIDVRLKDQDGGKFQPDVVGFSDGAKAPLICIDFESPNSSDARIPSKDIRAYINWNPVNAPKCPYIIVTALPNVATASWELRWTAEGYYNAKHRGRRAQILKNPWLYWSEQWRKDVKGLDMTNIGLININGRRAEPFELR